MNFKNDYKKISVIYNWYFFCCRLYKKTTVKLYFKNMVYKFYKKG